MCAYVRACGVCVCVLCCAVLCVCSLTDIECVVPVTSILVQLVRITVRTVSEGGESPDNATPILLNPRKCVI